jgi:hypothetical protein
MICQTETTGSRALIAPAHAPAQDDPRAGPAAHGSAPTGWDHLLQAIFEDPDARFPVQQRQQGIDLLTDALLTLELREAAVLTLRYGIGQEDRPGPVRPRRVVSEQLRVSHTLVTRLERSGLAALRAILRPAVVVYPERHISAACQRQRYNIGLN